MQLESIRYTFSIINRAGLLFSPLFLSNNNVYLSFRSSAPHRRVLSHRNERWMQQQQQIENMQIIVEQQQKLRQTMLMMTMQTAKHN